MYNKKIIIEQEAVSKNLQFFKQFNKTVLITTKNLEHIFPEIFKIFKKEIEKIIYIDDYSIKTSFELSHYVTVNQFDCIISFGGGTVNDVSKIISYYSNKYLISIPTIISNDGVSSNISVLQTEEGKTDGFSSKSPDAIIIDIDIIKNTDRKYINAGLCDILSNYTALYDWDLAVKNNKEEYHDFAHLLSSNAFWSIFNLPQDIEEELFIRLVSESLILSGISMEIKGNSRPCSGSEHLFNHAFMYLYPEKKILHGYLVGLGSIVSSILQGQKTKKIYEFLEKYNINLSPSSLGITQEEFINAWIIAKDMRDRYTILNEINYNKEDFLKIYNKIERSFKK